ncbi:MAG: hypothetical protein JST93_11710 [Acidobacteria bacterium]|nr:hypothetical protein [Acidobacteriota bacterium]
MFPSLGSMVIELTILAALVAVVIALALYRYFINKDQDFHIHMTASEASEVGKQSTVASRLTWVDKWGKSLTVVTLVYFLALLILILYKSWQQAQNVILTN